MIPVIHPLIMSILPLIFPNLISFVHFLVEFLAIFRGLGKFQAHRVIDHFFQ